jgi:hypothetical protein
MPERLSGFERVKSINASAAIIFQATAKTMIFYVASKAQIINPQEAEQEESCLWFHM